MILKINIELDDFGNNGRQKNSIRHFLKLSDELLSRNSSVFKYRIDIVYVQCKDLFLRLFEKIVKYGDAQLGRLGSLALIRQLVKEKENSGFKPAVTPCLLCLGKSIIKMNELFYSMSSRNINIIKPFKEDFINP